VRGAAGGARGGEEVGCRRASVCAVSVPRAIPDPAWVAGPISAGSSSVLTPPRVNNVGRSVHHRSCIHIFDDVGDEG